MEKALEMRDLVHGQNHVVDAVDDWTAGYGVRQRLMELIEALR